MTREANRLADIVVTIRGSIGNAMSELEAAKLRLDKLDVDRPEDWRELSKTLYRAQTALMTPASLAFEEAKR
jgi:hypothetical protein